MKNMNIDWIINLKPTVLKKKKNGTFEPATCCRKTRQIHPSTLLHWVAHGPTPLVNFSKLYICSIPDTTTQNLKPPFPPT